MQKKNNNSSCCFIQKTKKNVLYHEKLMHITPKDSACEVCWYCEESLEGLVVIKLPPIYGDRYSPECFCSLSCMKAFIVRNLSPCRREKVNEQLRNSAGFLQYACTPTSPPKHYLKKYGGSWTLEQYRSYVVQKYEENIKHLQKNHNMYGMEVEGPVFHEKTGKLIGLVDVWDMDGKSEEIIVEKIKERGDGCPKVKSIEEAMNAINFIPPDIKLKKKIEKKKRRGKKPNNNNNASTVVNS